MVEKTIEKVKKTEEEKKIELDSKNAEKQALKAIASKILKNETFFE